MFATIKSNVFIDALTVVLSDSTKNQLRAILRDDKGCACKSLEVPVIHGQNSITWKGLNDLPYGVYTLELFHGEEETRLRLVKRV